MSDFLTRLAGRALGTAPVAQPSIPSTFTPTAEPDGISAVSEFSEAEARNERGERIPDALVDSPQARMQSPSTLPNTRGPSVRPDPPIDSRESRTVKASHVEHLEPDSPEPIRARADLAVGAAPIPAPKSRPVDSIPRLEAAHIAASPAHEISRTIPESRGVPLARNYSDRAARPIAPISSRPPAPIIRVTIGRVDVRAEFPAQAAPTARRRAEAPSLTLDDYLKLRNEGKR
jgi:hypothetical protein